MSWKKYLFIGLVPAVLVLMALTQSNLLSTLRAAFTTYQNQEPEKLYLHTDKPFYSSGEVIWFKVYQVSAVDHRPGGPSGLARVDLLDPEGDLAFSRFIKLVDGSAPGDIRLPDTLPTGEYQLLAYTHYMRALNEDFLFKKPIQIWNRLETLSSAASADTAGSAVGLVAPEPGDSIILRFFPEGGDLVAGLQSRVAVRAEDPLARGRSVRGSVLDEQGRAVARFETNGLGLGSFAFTPAPETTYQAILADGQGQSYALPAALPQGYVLRVERAADASLAVVVAASADRNLEGLHLVGQIRGNLLFVHRYPGGAASAWEQVISLDDAPTGVLQLTLMDEEARPFAERLVFADPPRETAELRIQSVRESYSTRSPVTLQLDLLSPDGRPLAGDLSATVTERTLVPRDATTGNVRTWLLLESDLRGQIPRPNYFFQPGKEEELDLLMLTQGWRRFTWQGLLEGDWPGRRNARQGFTVSGNITRLGTDEGVSSYIWMNTLGYGEVLEARTVSLPDGRFAIHDLPIEDTTVVVVQAREPRNGRVAITDIPENPRGRRELDINFTEPEVPRPDLPLLPGLVLPERAKPEEYLAESRQIRTIEQAFGGISVYLDEVVVRAERIDRQTVDRPGMIYREPDNRIIADSMRQYMQPNSAFDYLRTTAGVRVSGAFPNEQAFVRGGRPQYLLDGMPVDLQVIQSLNPNDIAFVDVLKGPSAAIFGGRGANGVIAFYTRRGDEVQVPERGPGIDYFTHPGFYQARSFFQPVYEEPMPEHERPDYRTTLFWKPDIRLGNDGKALITIWTSDQNGQFDLQVEGVARTGEPVVGTHSFTVRNR